MVVYTLLYGRKRKPTMSANPQIPQYNNQTEDQSKTLSSDNARLHYKPQNAPQFRDEVEQETLVLSPVNHDRPAVKRPFWFQAAQTLGILGSIAWVITCIAYYTLEGGWATQSPYEMGVFMAGILAPIAFYWMLLSYLQRKSDVQFYAESLRAEMHSLFFPSEDDTRRTNKDIEVMMRQASELATTSKAAMQSIQKTRQGLREEIKQFASFAQKAEGHMVGLADGLSDRVVGLSDMVDVIKQRIELIEEKSQGSITSWDEASVKMVERANDIEATMEKGAHSLMAMADLAEDKSKSVSEMFDGTITSLGMTVDAVVDRLGSMNEQFGAHTRTLSISTEELSKETERVRVMIDDHADILNDATGKAVENITGALLTVSNHKEDLEAASNSIATRTETLSSTINGSLSQLHDTTRDIVGKTEDIAHSISDKSAIISKVMDGFDDQIDRMDSTSKTASHRLTETIDATYSSASEISDASRKASELLLQTSETTKNDAQIMIEQISDHVEKLENFETQNKFMIETMSHVMGDIHGKIIQSNLIVENQMDVMTDRFETQKSDLKDLTKGICNTITQTIASIEDPMRQMSIAVAEADTRHKQIETTLDTRIDAIKDASDKAIENVEIIRTSLREQTQDISSLSGQILQQSKSITDDIRGQNNDLTDIIDHQANKINGYMALLNQAQDKMTSVSDDLSVTVEAMEDKISGGITLMDESADRAVDILRTSGVSFTDKVENFSAVIQSTEDTLDQAHTKLGQATDNIMPLYDRLQSHANKATVDMQSYEESLSSVITSSTEKLDGAAARYAVHIAELKDKANDTSSVLNNSSEQLNTNMTSMDISLQSANDRMNTMSASLESQSENIHILTDKAILKIDSVQNTLQNQFQELSENVGLSVSQIEEAGDKFTNRAAKISQESDIIVSRIHTIGDEAQTKAYELKQATQNIADITTQSIQTMTHEMNVMTSNGEEALMNLQKTADTLSIKSKDIDAATESVLGQAKSYVLDVRDHIAKIANQTEDTAVQIGQSVSTLTQTMDKVTDKTKTAVDYIKDTNQSLFVQSGQFIASVVKSTDTVEEATKTFISQTDNLLKASNTASQKIEDIRRNELQAGQKSFLSSARFVLESLHSLSIDFVRVIDGDITDKDWKSFQNGDIAVFSTKLAQRLNELPNDKIRDKFENDGDFRNYVQKFMRQFEDILNQTDTVDKGTILSAVFSSSDIGKIYSYLCDVTGRQKAA
jgi:methyl-accepting chemotaxis protein